MNEIDNKSVCVIMSTYNGEKYLEEQIQSIFAQESVNTCLYVRDDGSTDSTLDILSRYADSETLVSKGVNIGAKYSFLKALSEAPDSAYYAFSDQDDVWDKDKLIKAVQQLKRVDQNRPALYCSATRLVDGELKEIKQKTVYPRRKYKLRQSKTAAREYNFLQGEIRPASGCTMVINKTLKDEICNYSPRVFPMHDYWIIIVCTALGGSVIYDPIPHISYRQHDNNTVGGRKGILKSVVRRINFYKQMGKQYHKKMYLEILDAYESKMPLEHRTRAREICLYDKGIKYKAKILFNSLLWKGRLRWRIEMLTLILTNNY